MDKKLVILDYSFMFNPDEAWDKLSRFEGDLASFFYACGYDLQVIKSIEGGSSKRILYVSPLPKDSLKETIVKSHTPQAQLAKLKIKTSQDKVLAKKHVAGK